MNLSGEPEMPAADWFRPDQWAAAPAEFGLQNLGAPGYQSYARSLDRERRAVFLAQDAALGDRDDLYESSLSAFSANPRVLTARRAAPVMDEFVSQASLAAPDVVFPARPR